jgi:hypothetical protein
VSRNDEPGTLGPADESDGDSLTFQNAQDDELDLDDSDIESDPGMKKEATVDSSDEYEEEEERRDGCDDSWSDC